MARLTFGGNIIKTGTTFNGLAHALASTRRSDELVNCDLSLWRRLLRRKSSQVRRGTPRRSNPALVTANMPEPDADNRPAIDLPASSGGLTFHEPHPRPGKHRQRRAVQILGGDHQPGRLARFAGVSDKQASQLRNHCPGHMAKVPPCCAAQPGTIQPDTPGAT